MTFRTIDTDMVSWRSKGARFVKYLTTRHPECWGFFVAGIVIAKIFF